MTNIILCGGSGTRLWPLSRTLLPKQFIKLFNDKSLFQLTVTRNQTLCNHQLIVSNAEQYFLATEQLEELGKSNNSYLLEPIGRDTAPAIALACFSLDEESIVLVTPSDHLIKESLAYEKVLHRAKELAQQEYLVTFGITPTSAHTGFGYIEANGEDVQAFHEKPNLEKAKAYVEQGNYYWNSGMFCFKVKVFLEELKRYAPKIYTTAQDAHKLASKDTLTRIKHLDMEKIPKNSIDYAVMEHSQKVKVVPSNIGWSDVGSFDALNEELPRDLNENTLSNNHIGIGSKNNFIYSSSRTIATIGIENLVIVDSDDALLITQKGSTQKVKEVVQELQSRGSELHNIHVTGHRPWGTYTVLEDASGYKIKRIEVKPNRRLSLQKHFHRNEHWIVVSGTATVRVGEVTKLVRPNESTYIKMGEVHRLENEGKIPLVLIEVQVGEYTGEDDIIRLEDDFKREES